jgi:hypothetical protein
VIDLEKLRHINCGLGQFSLHFGREMLKAAGGRFEPVFLLKKGTEAYLPGVSFERIAVVPWRKEVICRLARPLLQPFLPRPSIAAWHVTNQMSRYMPLDSRVPVVLTIHDLNFLHEAPHDEQLRATGRKLAGRRDRHRFRVRGPGRGRAHRSRGSAGARGAPRPLRAGGRVP